MFCCNNNNNKTKRNVYRGTTKNRKRDGFGILYDKDNKIKYEGDWVNDKKHGIGTQNLDSGTYVGYFVNGFREGKGKYTWLNGDVYNGEFNNGHFNGKAEFYNNQTKETTIGHFLHLKKNGHVKQYNKNGDMIFCGEWLNDMKNGFGYLYHENEIIKEGYWVNDKYSHEETIIDDNDLCCVCYQNKKINAFIPCGHLCICEECKLKYDSKLCIICRENSTHIQKIY